MHFNTCAASNHCSPVLEKGLKVLFKYCVLVGSSSMAAGLFLGPGLSVQVVDCCCRSDSTLAFLELKLSTACRCVAGISFMQSISKKRSDQGTDVHSMCLMLPWTLAASLLFAAQKQKHFSMCLQSLQPC